MSYVGALFNHCIKMVTISLLSPSHDGVITNSLYDPLDMVIGLVDLSDPDSYASGIFWLLPGTQKVDSMID